MQRVGKPSSIFGHGCLPMLLKRKVEHSGKNNEFVYKSTPHFLIVYFGLKRRLYDGLAHRDVYELLKGLKTLIFYQNG